MKKNWIYTLCKIKLYCVNLWETPRIFGQDIKCSLKRLKTTVLTKFYGKNLNYKKNIIDSMVYLY